LVIVPSVLAWFDWQAANASSNAKVVARIPPHLFLLLIAEILGGPVDGPPASFLRLSPRRASFRAPAA
jgi:hypothetical protein